MKLKKHIIRFSCRKEKKALKNHPCKKTKRGRYIINVMNSSFDYGGVGIGFHNGYAIRQHNKGYEHPLGHFFEGLMKGAIPWRFNENDYPQEDCEIPEFDFEL